MPWGVRAVAACAVRALVVVNMWWLCCATVLWSALQYSSSVVLLFAGNARC